MERPLTEQRWGWLSVYWEYQHGSPSHLILWDWLRFHIEGVLRAWWRHNSGCLSGCLIAVLIEVRGNILDTSNHTVGNLQQWLIQRESWPTSHPPGLKGAAGHSAQAASRPTSWESHRKASSGATQDIWQQYLAGKEVKVLKTETSTAIYHNFLPQSGWQE